MARRRKGTDDGPRVSGYQPTASPTRPPTSHLYFTSPDGGLVTFGFTQDEYARAAIDCFLGESRASWVKDSVGRITLEAEGFRVREGLDKLEKLMETEPADDLPEHISRQLLSFRAGVRPPLKDANGEDLKPREKVERVKREPKEKAPKKEKPAGMKGVPELAADLQREGGEIRVILRKHVEKPGIGWLWSNDDYLKVRAVVKSKLG